MSNLIENYNQDTVLLQKYKKIRGETTKGRILGYDREYV